MINSPITRRPLATAIAAAALSLATAPTFAQLEEVIVTATKRAESLQDVPISMISMSGESIKVGLLRRRL